MKSVRVINLLSPIKNSSRYWAVIKRTTCAKTESFYDLRKLKCKLPDDNVSPQFETLPYIPKGIFRPTEGESLGKFNAGKCSLYKNPEYFSFHHMTFYDMMIYIAKYRKGVSPTGRKASIKGN